MTRNDSLLPAMNPSALPAGRQYWPQWLDRLRAWGVDQSAAVLLESAGPLNLLLAQFVYLGQAFFPGRQAGQLAAMLENHEETRAFAAFLREEELH